MKRFAALIAIFALVVFAAPAMAANPFMDVPMNHWAYDAVSQLASRGVVSGYPDGAFKGEWKATRYEMASVVARALAYVDMNKASKEDLELLKRLVVEFKDELDALGVKVEDLDARVAVLESDIGGWALSGQFRFDAKWADDGGVYNLTGDTDFTMSRYRLWITKRIDDKVKFIGRVGGNTLSWERYYLEIQMPWDATAWVGLWNFDWEGEDGFYNDNDAWFTDQTLYGFYMAKPFGMGHFDVFVAHEDDAEDPEMDYYVYGARLKFDFNEMFGMGVAGIWKNYENYGNDSTYWVQAHVNFTPDITLRGRYIWQDLFAYPDSTTAWHAILDVKQAVTGFTSIWIEYASMDDEFYTINKPWDNYGAMINYNGDTESIFFVRLDQQWNDKWATFQRYLVYRDLDGSQWDLTNWTVGVKYWYTPALSFELLYDKFDGNINRSNDSMIRLRTFVSF